MERKEVYWRELDKSFWRTELDRQMLENGGAKMIRRRKHEIIWVIFDKEFVLYSIAKMISSLTMDIEEFINFIKENESSIKRKMFI